MTVRLKNVSKLYGKIRALDDISLDIAPGELIALLGSSGCGKTTLLRSVAGLESPTKGQVFINNQDVTGLPTRKRPIGMLFQSYALFPNLTLRQNIAFPLKVRGQDSQKIKARVAELVELVNLSEQAERYPNQVSGGQQQRAALARALAPSPQVLLLDEPLSALDAVVRIYLRDEIRRIQQKVGITTLYVTHDQAEAMAIADRVAIMSEGKIEQIAAPLEIYDTPSTRFSASFVGNRNALELPVNKGRVTLGQALDVAAPLELTKSALVFFRPEDVEFSANSPGYPAIVESKIFQGAVTRVYLTTEVDGQKFQLFADQPSRMVTSIEIGSQVNFRINPTNIRIFSPNA